MHINHKTNLTEKEFFKRMVNIGYKPYKIYSKDTFSDICDRQEDFIPRLLQVWEK
jgi:hypothetical protein